jgi:hypothetical protein
MGFPGEGVGGRFQREVERPTAGEKSWVNPSSKEKSMPS